MTVVKRFHDCLLPTHAAVQEQYQKVKKLAVIDGFLTRASGYQFYNTSKFTFDLLLADPDNIETNFRDYLAGFSANVQDVLAKFDFDNIIKRMVECNSLYLVIKEFASPKGYLGPDKISAVDCGYIFEDLVKRFSESYDEEAGAHFTSRDIIYLMTDILLSDADLSQAGNVTVYDMAMGTSQMLSCMEERIHDLNEDIEVTCFGQELNPATYAIAKADMMIRGGDPNNMRFGDTLSTDQFMNTGISTYIGSTEKVEIGEYMQGNYNIYAKKPCRIRKCAPIRYFNDADHSLVMQYIHAGSTCVAPQNRHFCV